MGHEKGDEMSDEQDHAPAPGSERPRLGRALARLMGEAPPPGPSPEHGAEADVLPPDPEAELLAQRQPGEHGGPKGPEPTRYGDWERKGRCVDF